MYIHIWTDNWGKCCIKVITWKIENTPNETIALCTQFSWKNVTMSLFLLVAFDTFLQGRY